MVILRLRRWLPESREIGTHKRLNVERGAGNKEIEERREVEEKGKKCGERLMASLYFSLTHVTSIIKI